MHKTPEQIEAILGKLVPTALSVEATESIGTMLDGLSPSAAATQPRPARAVGGSRKRFLLPFSAAAALCLAALSWDRRDGNGTLPPGVVSAPAEGFRLVAHSGRIDAVDDIGWSTDETGSALHTVRLSVVEEAELLDAETGMLMTLRQPREEILLTPVTSF
jgi:hypothetical protein